MQQKLCLDSHQWQCYDYDSAFECRLWPRLRTRDREDREQITPKPHHHLASSSTAFAFQPINNPEFEVQVGVEPTTDNGHEIFPSSASSSSCDSTASSPGTRSRSPVQCIADFRTAARPTILKHLDAASAAEAGGVLGRYQRLRAIHNAHQVIPSSLRVSNPEC